MRPALTTDGDAIPEPLPDLGYRGGLRPGVDVHDRDAIAALLDARDEDAVTPPSAGSTPARR